MTRTSSARARAPKSRTGRSRKTTDANLITHAFARHGRPYSVRDWEAVVRMGRAGFNETTRRCRMTSRYGSSIREPQIYRAPKADGYPFGQMYRNEISFYCSQVGISLAGANLSGMDLRGYDLTGVDLSSANLARADLRGAVLHWTNLTNANLRDTDLRGCKIDQVLLAGVRLSGTNLSDARFVECFVSAGARNNAPWTRVIADGLSFERCELRGAQLQLIARTRPVVMTQTRLSHREGYWQGPRRDYGNGREWREVDQHTEISGDICELVISRSRVHSLIVSGCRTLRLAGTEYVWIQRADNVRQLIVDSELTRDHGGMIFATGNVKVTAPRWHRHDAGDGGVLLDLAPARSRGSWVDAPPTDTWMNEVCSARNLLIAGARTI
jgi:hypothetical protein